MSNIEYREGFCTTCGEQYPKHRPGCPYAGPEDGEPKARAGLVNMRMEVSAMKVQLQRAFHTEYIPELKASVDASIDEVLQGFDFKSHVMEEAHAALREFTKEVIHKAVEEVLDDEELRKSVQVEVTKGVKKLKKQMADSAIETIKQRLDRGYGY